MNRVMFKFRVPIDDRWHGVYLSPGAEPLHVGTQDRFGVTFWAEVNPLSLNVHWEFRVYPTGHQIDDNEAAYRGTVQDGGAVWHLYEKAGK